MTYIIKWNTKFYLTKERVSKFVLIQIIKLNCDFSDKNVDNRMKKILYNWKYSLAWGVYNDTNIFII